MAHEVGVGLLDVRAQVLVWELVEPAAPDDVVHPAVESQLMSLGLERVDRGHEAQADRPGEGGLDQEARPAGLLDQVDGVAVGELGAGAGDALPQPLAEVGGPAEIDEKGVGHAEITADGADARKTVGDADAMIDIPAKGEQPVAHRRALATTSA